MVLYHFSLLSPNPLESRGTGKIDVQKRRKRKGERSSRYHRYHAGEIASRQTAVSSCLP